MAGSISGNYVLPKGLVAGSISGNYALPKGSLAGSISGNYALHKGANVKCSLKMKKALENTKIYCPGFIDVK